MSSQNARPVFADPLIDDVRWRRRDLLTSCGDDLATLALLIRQREAEHPERVADPRATHAAKSPEKA
jgi:hypothetical protein